MAASEANSLLQTRARPRDSVDSHVDKLIKKFGLPFESHPSASGAQVSLIATGASTARADGMFSLPPLPYKYDALEPHIDAATMKFHHDFHHQAYIDKLNAAMEGKKKVSLESLMPGAKAANLNNAAGGHYNHCLLWTVMGPKAGGAPTGPLADKIDEAFGSFKGFKTNFSEAAAGVFGSGWAWLAVAKDGTVKIVTTPNQDNPLMDGVTEPGLIPILGIDVWEHAYYLKYQNRRPEYIDAFYNVINWDKVGEYFKKAGQGKSISF